MPLLVSEIIACAAASAMQVFNSMRIVHRDLKPQNILLCYPGSTTPPALEITLKIGNKR